MIRIMYSPPSEDSKFIKAVEEMVREFLADFGNFADKVSEVRVAYTSSDCAIKAIIEGLPLDDEFIPTVLVRKKELKRDPTAVAGLLTQTTLKQLIAALRQLQTHSDTLR